MRDDFAPRCMQCRRVLTEVMVEMTPTSITVIGDCVKHGTAVTASHDSWSPEDFLLDLDGNVLGQLELPIGV